MSTYDFPFTSLPCPNWCALPLGHGFDWSDGLLYRSHSRTFGGSAAPVELVSDEFADDACGPVVKTSPVEISLLDIGNPINLDTMTGSQARALAAALVEAADGWDAANA